MTDTNASLAPLQQQLDDALRRFSPLTTQDLAMLHRVVTFRTFARGECFVEAGAPATESALVLEGVFRERREMPGEVPITVCFSAEGDLVGPVADLIAKRPRASSHIAALTTATVAVVKWADFRALCAQALAWERLYTTVIERLFLAKVERERQLLSMSAAERLAWFEGRHSSVAQRVAQVELASFLGMTPVHFSRLRRMRVMQRRQAARSHGSEHTAR